MKKAIYLAEMMGTIIFLFLNPLSSNAQTYGSGSTTIIQSMKSAALGGATVALDGYAGAALINPATIGINHTLQVQSFLFNQKSAPFNWPYIHPSGNKPYSFFSPTIDYRQNKWATAISLSYYDISSLKNSGIYGNTKGRNFYESTFQLAGSWELNSSFRLGIGLKQFGTRIPVPTLSVGNDRNVITGKATAIDLGAYYHKTTSFNTLPIKLSFGASLLNFGTDYRYDNGQKDALPLSINAGFGFKFQSGQRWNERPILGLGLYGSLSHILSRYNQNGQPYNAFKALFKGWGSYKNFDGRSYKTVELGDQIEQHFGLETSILDILDFRWGVDYLSPNAMLSYGRIHSWGFGIDLYYLVFDYTTIKHQSNIILGTQHVWQVTLRIPFAHSPRNFWWHILSR